MQNSVYLLYPAKLYDGLRLILLLKAYRVSVLKLKNDRRGVNLNITPQIIFGTTIS